MPAFDDIPFHKTPAEAVDIQQIIDAITGRRNTPLTSIVNDPLAYAWTIKNTDTAGRGLMIFAPDGTTVLFSVDATGAKVSRAGAAAQAPITDLGPGAGEAAEGDHVHGAGGYAGTGAVSLESLYAGATVVTAVNYVVIPAVLYVFCTLGVTVTLPAAATTNRPVTVAAVSGTTTVNAVSGTVIGGSTNITTGLVMDGIVSPGDSMTYKSDGTNWRVV
jgi:hypothetical protein